MYGFFLWLADELYNSGEEDLATDLMVRLLIYKISEVVYKLCQGDDK